MNIWKWLKQWWENIKPVVLNWVLPKLNELKVPLAERLKSIEGTPEQQANIIIEFINDYIKRQL